MSDFNPAEATNFQLLEFYERAEQGIEDLEAGMVVIREELKLRLLEEKSNGMNIGDWQVLLKEKYEYPELTLDEARSLSAVTSVKASERINKTKVHALVQAGAPIKEEIIFYAEPKKKKLKGDEVEG